MSPDECNADINGCTGGAYNPELDRNDPCSACLEWRRQGEAEARAAWAVASPQERDPEGYRRDMIDGGRGHLLRDDE